MGTLLDASALIAFLDDEPAASEVESMLSAGTAAIPSVNLAEAAQRVLRERGATAGELRELVSALPLAVVPVTESHAWRAAELRATHYRRMESEVSLADCCLVAVATAADRVASSDPALLRMANAEGLAVAALPDSRGP